MDAYSLSDLWSILVMQGFSGLSLFSVLLLMALGLAIILDRWASSTWPMVSS